MSVFYKFASQKEHDVCKVDGPNISVFELKREIIIAKRLGKGTDFDLALYNAQTNEEYASDTHSIPRGTSIIVRRMPASRPGKGTAQRYLEGGGIPMSSGRSGGGGRSEYLKDGGHKGRGHMSVSFVEKAHNAVQQAHNAASQPSVESNVLSLNPADDSEEARIATMFKQTQELWNKQQEQMAQHRPIYYGGRGRGRGRGGGGHGHHGEHHAQQERPLPPNYVCYRCGQKGHHIAMCPTNSDPEYDKPRLKKTTGIPRCFLKTVDSSAVAANKSGVMVTPDGGLVVATANDRAWQKLKASSAVAEGVYDYMSQVPVIPELKCFLCEGLYRDAVYTACCQAAYCDECIRKHLLEHNFKCPSCHKKEQLLDTLTPDEELRVKVDDHIRSNLGGAAPRRKVSPLPPASHSGTATPRRRDGSKEPRSTASASPVRGESEEKVSANGDLKGAPEGTSRALYSTRDGNSGEDPARIDIGPTPRSQQDVRAGLFISPEQQMMAAAAMAASIPPFPDMLGLMGAQASPFGMPPPAFIGMVPHGVMGGPVMMGMPMGMPPGMLGIPPMGLPPMGTPSFAMPAGLRHGSPNGYLAKRVGESVGVKRSLDSDGVGGKRARTE